MSELSVIYFTTENLLLLFSYDLRRWQRWVANVLYSSGGSTTQPRKHSRRL